MASATNQITQKLLKTSFLYYKFIYKVILQCYIRPINQGTPKKGNEEMFFTNIMFKLHQDSYELSQRSFLPELRDILARPYKTKYNDFHIKTP